MQPGTPAPQDSPAVAPPLHAKTTFAGRSAATIAELPADGATAFRPFAGAWAIPSHATPISKRRLDKPNDGAVAPPTSVAPGGSLPTPKRTGEHLSQNERSAKAPRMENMQSFTPASRIDMAESSNDKPREGLTDVEPVLEAQDGLNSLNASITPMLSELRRDLERDLKREFDREFGVGFEGNFGGVLGEDYWENFGDNSRLAAGPSADIQGLDTENPLVASSKARSPHPIIGQERMESARHAVPASRPQACAISTQPREHKLPTPEKRQEETRPEPGMNPTKPKSAFKLPEATQKEALGAKACRYTQLTWHGKILPPSPVSD